MGGFRPAARFKKNIGIKSAQWVEWRLKTILILAASATRRWLFGPESHHLDPPNKSSEFVVRASKQEYSTMIPNKINVTRDPN